MQYIGVCECVLSSVSSQRTKLVKKCVLWCEEQKNRPFGLSQQENLSLLRVEDFNSGSEGPGGGHRGS